MERGQRWGHYVPKVLEALYESHRRPMQEPVSRLNHAPTIYYKNGAFVGHLMGRLEHQSLDLSYI